MIGSALLFAAIGHAVEGPAPSPSLPPNFAFDCELYPNVDDQSSKISGTLRSKTETDTGVAVPSDVTIFQITLNSTDDRFEGMAQSTASFKVGLQLRPKFASRDFSDPNYAKRTTYKFNLPHVSGPTNEDSLQGTVSVWAFDPAGTSGNHRPLMAVGICDLSHLEAAQ